MELLINGIMQKGGKRSRLEAKLFGGARTMKGLSDIGAMNQAFAEDFCGMKAFASSAEISVAIAGGASSIGLFPAVRGRCCLAATPRSRRPPCHRQAWATWIYF